jgi:uncharacterized membrane protein HdeD (DUF308 family)
MGAKADIRNTTRSARQSTTRSVVFDGLLTLFAGPFVLAALLLSIIVIAFNVWPTFNRFSEWGD